MTQTMLFPGPFVTEAGAVFPSVRIAYRTWGTLAADASNVVWICHALTGSSDADTWWSELIGPGRVIDTTTCFVVCANMLGSCYGSTGPTDTDASTNRIYGPAFPFITARDIVCAFDALRSHLGIDSIRVLIGGSMGGQHVLEWAALAPDRIECIVPIATNAKHSPWGIAWNAAQRMALEADSTFALYETNAGERGLAAARAVAMLSYRTRMLFDGKQRDDNEAFDDFRAERYQRYQGRTLVHRFNAHAYWTLTKAMDAHDIGRGRGGPGAALRAIRARTLVVGIDTDQLFPVHEQEFIADMVPRAVYRMMRSTAGHDAFLLDQHQLSRILQSERILHLS